MASKWLSVSQASQTLGISASTIRRRIAGDAIKWRDGERGREVCVRFDQQGNTADLAVNPRVSGAKKNKTKADKKQASFKTKNRARKSQAKTDSIKKEGAALGVAGKYSALPDQAAEPFGQPKDGGGGQKKENGRWPKGRPGFMRPGAAMEDGADEADSSPEAQAKRFQKLAGASVLLAQRQTDEANEKLALVHNQMYRMRQMMYTSWAAVALIAVVSIVSTGFLGGEKLPAANASVAENDRFQPGWTYQNGEKVFIGEKDGEPFMIPEEMILETNALTDQVDQLRAIIWDQNEELEKLRREVE